MLLEGEKQTKVMAYQDVFDKLREKWGLSVKEYSLIGDEADISTSSVKNLGKQVEGLGKECDISAKSLSSFSKFLAEGKLGDLSHLDTSKQNGVFEAPSAELEDYKIEYPEKAPKPVKKGNYGIDEKVPIFSGRSNALPDDYNRQDTSKQNEEFPPPSAELDKYEIDYPEKAPKQGFFGGMKESFKSGLDDLKKQFGLGGDKGLLGNLFGGKDTGGGLFGMLGSLGGPQSGIVGMLQSVTSMIPGIGTMISGIIGGVATAFNALKSLFGGLTEEEKVAKDVTRDLGVSISEELAKKIADTSKEVGDRFTAVTMHLGDIMRETDITADNFDTFASRARDVFSLLETGMMNSAQATSTLNDVFPQLAEEADKLGITFNKNMIDMIQLSRQFGLEVESIKQYVDEKLGTAVQGLTTATQNLGEIGQAEFDRLARAAAATFQELMKNGTDVTTAIDQMKEVISNLGKAQEEYGLKGSAAFNQLKRYSNLVETNRSVIESVKGMSDVYTSLAQVGGMNQKLFNDWQTDTLSNYDKLIAGGFKQNEALAMMAPTLQSLKEAHDTMGLKIDANTQALIDQASAAGLLKPDPMQQMTDAVIEMTDSVDRLIDYLSGSSPPCGSLLESFDKAKLATMSYGKELINALSPLPVENLISKMGEIPKEIGVHVGYTYDEYAGPYGGSHGGGTGPGKKPYGAQHGGIFTVPTHLLVGENPVYNPEVVLNRQQMENLVGNLTKPARNLNSSSNQPQQIVIHNYLGTELIETKIFNMIKQGSRDGKLRIDERAIES
jgi:polyhydroxyalkanoate synthesis regulator phasin